MRMMIVVMLTCFWFTAGPVCAQPAQADDTQKKLTPQEKKLAERSESLSNSTLNGGPGWETYQTFLHTDFNRWSESAGVLNRVQSVDMIKHWWEAGNRVSKSDDKLLSIQIAGSTGVLRKQTTEHFVDKNGKSSGSFSGYVTQVWTRKTDEWKILSTTIQRARQK